MAKRKRLNVPETQAAAPEAPAPALETKSAFPMGVARMAPRRAPIAQVAGDAAAHSALDALAEEMAAARRDGRLVVSLPLDAVSADHMVRDRMVLDPAEMEALQTSLRTRGQQMPIEVVALEEGRYGLISGWRRLQALQALHAETGEARFATIQALIKPLDGVSDSYVAMVEENEIRVGLSYYERARLACEAARLGVYDSPAEAVQVLFAAGSPAKRSKIGTFVRLYQVLGEILSFPTEIPERLGLALTAALEADPHFAPRLRDALRKTPPADAAAERAALERALKKTAKRPASAPVSIEIAPGLKLERRDSCAVVSGKAVTPELVSDLEAWLRSR